MPFIKLNSNDPESLAFRWILILGLSLILVISLIVMIADFSLLVVLTIIPSVIVFWMLVAYHVKQSVQRQLYSLANVMESLRLGDYTIRGYSDNVAESWSDVFNEINHLAQSTQVDRWQSIESNLLLDKLLAEFIIPVFMFDRELVLRNLNITAAKLFPTTKEKLVGLHAEQLHMQDLLKPRDEKVVEHWFPNHGGRWELSHNTFLLDGKQYTLLFVNDLSQALREEERLAWQRLIRVIGHELNNSLASIISVSDNVLNRLSQTEIEQSQKHLKQSLSVISERSHSLLRFTEAYTRLAKLPKPNKEQVNVTELFARVTNLLEGEFIFDSDQSLIVNADPDQLEQMFINLLKNAIEASENEMPVTIEYQSFERGIKVNIIDHGIGLPSSDSLFVPFFTTKEHGNGIGLFLSRQIAEAHEGSISLSNNDNGNGCTVSIWLPK